MEVFWRWFCKLFVYVMTSNRKLRVSRGWLRSFMIIGWILLEFELRTLKIRRVLRGDFLRDLLRPVGPRGFRFWLILDLILEGDYLTFHTAYSVSDPIMITIGVDRVKLVLLGELGSSSCPCRSSTNQLLISRGIGSLVLPLRNASLQFHSESNVLVYSPLKSLRMP